MRGRPGRKKKLVKSDSEDEKQEESDSDQDQKSGKKRADKDSRKQQEESEGENEEDEESEKSSEPKKAPEVVKKSKVKQKPIAKKGNKESSDDDVPLKSKDAISKKKDKKTAKKPIKEKPKDVEMEEEVASTKPKDTKAKPSVAVKEKSRDPSMEVDKESSRKGDKVAEKAESEQSKSKKDAGASSSSKLGKRPMETRQGPTPETKRKKTEKGEKSVGGDKRKIRYIEWQYGRHCNRDLWVGKKVKVKLPAKNKDDPSQYKFGKLVALKENSKGEKSIFQIEWTKDGKKIKEWIDLAENKVYIFGQLLFLKHHHESDQIEQIKSVYGWKGKHRKAIPIPVVELIDANDKTRKITPHEDPSEKIPIQYLASDKAKKIKQDVLYDYREFRDEDFEYLKENFKNGEKLYSKVTSYLKSYSQWIDKHSKIDINTQESLAEYCTKIVRVYKGDRN